MPSLPLIELPKVYDHIVRHHVLVLFLQLRIHSGQHETFDVHSIILMLPESVPFSMGGISGGADGKGPSKTYNSFSCLRTILKFRY